MICATTTHPRIRAGQIWHCGEDEAELVLIVALDSYSGGIALNVVVRDGQETNGVHEVLAPIDSRHVEPLLTDVLCEDADTSERLPSYAEWKELAQEGKAGVWTCSPAEVLGTVRRNMESNE